MDATQIESAVNIALSAVYGEKEKTAVNRISRSVATSISYDRTLAGITAEDISNILSGPGVTLEHADIMAMIREYRDKAREGVRKFTERKPSHLPSQETVNKGFFLRCWDAFRRDGDLSDIRLLTVSFLARWLINEKTYIEKEELDWCTRRALSEHPNAPGREKDPVVRATFEEAVVLLVMHKFGRAMKKDPEKTQSLLDKWRTEYTEYSVRQFGTEPDWSPMETGRRPLIILRQPTA